MKATSILSSAVCPFQYTQYRWDWHDSGNGFRNYTLLPLPPFPRLWPYHPIKYSIGNFSCVCLFCCRPLTVVSHISENFTIYPLENVQDGARWNNGEAIRGWVGVPRVAAPNDRIISMPFVLTFYDFRNFIPRFYTKLFSVFSFRSNCVQISPIVA